MFIDQPPSGPILLAITVRLSAAAGHQHSEARQEIVLRALATALIALDETSSLAWMVRAAPDDRPLQYDLTPLPGHSVSAEDAWLMVDALRGQAYVAAVEPIFANIAPSRRPPTS